MIDGLLVTFAGLFTIVGLLGCLLPIIPGPPLSYIGLLCLHFSDREEYSLNFLLFWLGITVLVTVMDYIVPVYGTKKYGGTKKGVWGSSIGLIVGLIFFPPFGIILGPLIGAFIGEIIGGQDSRKAFKSAIGSFIGFLIGTGFKLIAAGFMLYYFIVALLDK